MIDFFTEPWEFTFMQRALLAASFAALASASVKAALAPAPVEAALTTSLVKAAHARLPIKLSLGRVIHPKNKNRGE